MEAVRVLVVDDDTDFREMMVNHLRNKGFQVESAQDGLEAYEMLRLSGPVCVMVTDLVMPGLSGLELLRRAKKLDPLLEVIVITAVGSIELAISALREDGAYDYLSKPFEIIGELSLAVERAATHRQIRLERESLRGSLARGTRRLKEILSCTGIPIIAGNEKDELILVSQAAIPIGIQRRDSYSTRKDILPEYIKTIVKRWRSLGEKHVAWTETMGINREALLVKVIPLNIKDSPGWVMVIHDIMYQKRLERFFFRNYLTSMEASNQSMEKASLLHAEFTRKQSAGSGEHIEARRMMGMLVDEAEEERNGLLTYLDRSDTSSGIGHYVPLLQFVEKYQSTYQGLGPREIDTKVNWQIEEDLTELNVDPYLMSQFLNHLVQLIQLLHENQEEKTLNLWSAQGEVWLSVAQLGSYSYAKDLMPIIECGSDSESESFNHAQQKFIMLKCIAEKMGQVWIEYTETGDLNLAVCLTDDKS